MLEKSSLTNKLTPRQEAYLDELDDYYDTHGHLPEVLKTDLINDTFLAAVEFRSLPKPSQTKDSPISPKQRAAIKLVLDYNDRRPLRVKLDSLQINNATQTWHSWLKQPAFQKKYEQILDQRFKRASQDAKLSLLALIAQQDLPAIKYFHELTGEYRPTQETHVNLTLVLGSLMEVLTRFLPPDVLPAIADAIEAEVLPKLVPGSNQLERTTNGDAKI